MSVHQYRRKTAVFFFFFLFSASVFAQKDSVVTKDNIKANLQTEDTTTPRVYNIKPLSTAIIGAAATVANVIAINNVLHNKKDLSPTELQALRPDIVNRIDRWALNMNPRQRDQYYRASDHGLTATLVASAATFVLGKRTRKDWLRLGLMYYQTQFLTFAFYDFSPFGPMFQNRVRPVSYYDYFPIELRQRGNQRNSFYSGHVANAASAAFFAAKVYLDYHPEKRHKKFLYYGLASVPPLVTGYLRMKALAHFPSDVIAGYLIGSAFGIIVPELHRIKSRKFAVNTFYNGRSGGVNLAFRIGAKEKTFLMQ